MTPRLKIAYDKEIVGKLMSKLSLKNRHEVPKIEKIILTASGGPFLIKKRNIVFIISRNMP